MKNVRSIVFSPEQKRLSIELVISLMLRMNISEPHCPLTFGVLAASDPETKTETKAEAREKTKRETKLERVRSKFLSFCRDGNILPRKKDDPAACFNCASDLGKGNEFDISLEEFRIFARSYGRNVSTISP